MPYLPQFPPGANFYRFHPFCQINFRNDAVQDKQNGIFWLVRSGLPCLAAYFIKTFSGLALRWNLALRCLPWVRC